MENVRPRRVGPRRVGHPTVGSLRAPKGGSPTFRAYLSLPTSKISILPFSGVFSWNKTKTQGLPPPLPSPLPFPPPLSHTTPHHTTPHHTTPHHTTPHHTTPHHTTPHHHHRQAFHLRYGLRVNFQPGKTEIMLHTSGKDPTVTGFTLLEDGKCVLWTIVYTLEPQWEMTMPTLNGCTMRACNRTLHLLTVC